MGTAVVAIAGSLLTSVKLSDVHRKLVTAGAYARDYSEAVNSYVVNGGYDNGCDGSSDYGPEKVGFTDIPVGSPYTASVVLPVRYWAASGTAWSSALSSGVDLGLQRITVQVKSNDDRAIEQSVVVVRNPSGSLTC